MKTQDEINRAATEYAPHDEYHGATYQTNLLMKRQGFVRGANFANGYSVDDMCGFAEWVITECKPSLIKRSTYYYDKTGQYHSIQDLLELYNERK